MGKLSAVTSCLLLIAGAAMAQSVKAEQRLLPQWLTGLIAVTGFLFLAFVSMLVKRAWCEESNRGTSSSEPVRENDIVMTADNIYETNLDLVRSKENMNAYDNLVMNNTDDKVTSM